MIRVKRKCPPYSRSPAKARAPGGHMTCIRRRCSPAFLGHFLPRTPWSGLSFLCQVVLRRASKNEARWRALILRIPKPRRPPQHPDTPYENGGAQCPTMLKKPQLWRLGIPPSPQLQRRPKPRAARRLRWPFACVGSWHDGGGGGLSKEGWMLSEGHCR